MEDKHTAPRTGKRLLRSAVLAAVLASSTVASLLLLELAVRKAFPDLLQARPCYHYHPRRHWTLRPNSATNHYFRDSGGEIAWSFPLAISAQGLRDRDYGPKASDAYRILMLGDSFVYGHGVRHEETIPKQLELLLDQYYTDKNVSVVNGGVAMYSPWQSRDLLQEIGFTLAPDYVLLGLFIGNDVKDTMLRHGLHHRAYFPSHYIQYALFSNRQHWNFSLEYTLRRYWQTMNAFTQFLGWPEGGSVARALGRLPIGSSKPFPLFPPPQHRTPSLELDLVSWYPDLEQGYAILWGDIVGIKEDAAAKGLDFMLFSMPPQQMVYDHLWNAAIVSGNYERGKIARRLRASAEEHDIATAPVMEALLDVEQERMLYIADDGHLNAAGCRYVAEILFRYLTTKYPTSLPRVCPDNRGAATHEPTAPL